MYGLTLLTYPSRPASAEKFPPTSSLGTLVTIDSPVLAASVPLEICRSSCSTLMSCDCSPPSDTDTFISRTGVQVIVLKVAIVLRKTWLCYEKGILLTLDFSKWLKCNISKIRYHFCKFYYVTPPQNFNRLSS